MSLMALMRICMKSGLDIADGIGVVIGVVIATRKSLGLNGFKKVPHQSNHNQLRWGNHTPRTHCFLHSRNHRR